MTKMFGVLVLAAAGMCLPSQAGVIDFDAHGSDFGTPIFDSGFRFDLDAAGWGVFGPGSGACCSVNYNGTPAMFANGDRSGRASILMTPVGGGTFGVSELDASVYWMTTTGVIDLLGQINGGGTVSTSLSVGPGWKHFILSGFQNLTSLTFTDSQSGGFLGAPGIGIDNINTDAAGTATPEPASYASLAGGLVALVALARRKMA